MAGGSFQKLGGGFFQQGLEKAGIGKQVMAAQYIEFARVVLAEQFGGGAGKHARARAVKNRVLQIEVAHPAVGEEIRLREEAIISAVNKKIGCPEIVRIQLVLPQHGRELWES